MKRMTWESLHVKSLYPKIFYLSWWTVPVVRRETSYGRNFFFAIQKPSDSQFYWSLTFGSGTTIWKKSHRVNFSITRKIMSTNPISSATFNPLRSIVSELQPIEIWQISVVPPCISETINFRGFIYWSNVTPEGPWICMWNFCTLNRDTLYTISCMCHIQHRTNRLPHWYEFRKQ